MKEFIKKNQQILMVALVWIIGLGGLYSLNQYNTNQISAYYTKQVQIKRQKAREAKIKQDREDEKAIRHNQKYVGSKLG